MNGKRHDPVSIQHAKTVIQQSAGSFGCIPFAPAFRHQAPTDLYAGAGRHVVIDGSQSAPTDHGIAVLEHKGAPAETVARDLVGNHVEKGVAFLARPALREKPHDGRVMIETVEHGTVTRLVPMAQHQPVGRDRVARFHSAKSLRR